MFLYTHFNKKAYSGDLILSEPFPSDWIGVKDIERRYLSRWEEHCMECAAPECYGNCMYYIKRADGKCQNTFYGIKYRKDLGNDTVCPSQLKFRKWGKIETVFNPSSLLAVTYRKIEGRYARFNHKFPFSRRLLRLLNMELLVRNIKSQPTSFVLQCYSSSPSVFCLYFEIFGHNRHSILRRVFQVKNGYNQIVLSLSDIRLNVEEKMWVRVFPENEIRFLRRLSELKEYHFPTVISSGVADDGPWLEVTMVPGETMDSFFSNKANNRPLLIQSFLKEANRILHILVENAIIHRDFISQNLLIQAEGAHCRVSLIDFGWAIDSVDRENCLCPDGLGRYQLNDGYSDCYTFGRSIESQWRMPVVPYIRKIARQLQLIVSSDYDDAKELLEKLDRMEILISSSFSIRDRIALFAYHHRTFGRWYRRAINVMKISK